MQRCKKQVPGLPDAAYVPGGSGEGGNKDRAASWNKVLIRGNLLCLSFS